MSKFRITTVSNGTETEIHSFYSTNGAEDRRIAARLARELRDETGFEVRVYDELGLRGIMDAKLAA